MEDSGKSALKKSGKSSDDQQDEREQRSGSSSKKSRLQWDEANLEENEKEILRHPKMKIDEPKTPYHRQFSDSESGTAGSSLGDSEPPSPNAMVFIDDQHLKGFKSLETEMKEQQGSSSGSTPRSREDFEKLRKRHYHKEFVKKYDADDERNADEAEDDDEGIEKAANGSIDRHLVKEKKQKENHDE